MQFKEETIMVRKFSLISISLIAILLLISCSRSEQYIDNGIADDVYIRIADGAAESQAFLRQFPEAEILVDRSSKLAVDYRFTQFQPTSTEQSWQGIRLRIFIDPRDNRVDDSFIQCSDQNGSTIVEEELIAFIEKYGETKTCR